MRPDDTSRVSVYLPAAIAALAFAFFSLVARLAPFDIGDEGYLYYVAWQVSEGALLFRDIELFTYTPGIFYVWAGWFELFGTSVLEGRTLGVALATCNVLLIFWVVRAFGGSPVLAMIVALLFVLVHPWLFRSHIPMLNMAALIAALRAVQHQSRLPLVALGALSVIGAAIRLDAAATAGILCGAAILMRSSGSRWSSLVRDGTAAAAGALAVSMLTIAAFARGGVLSGWFMQMAEFLAFAAARSVASYKLPFPWFTPLGAVMLCSVGLLFVGMVESARARRDNDIMGSKMMALLCLHALLNMPQFLVERPDGPHFADRSFAVLLLAAAISARISFGGVAGLQLASLWQKVANFLLLSWGATLIFWAATGWGIAAGQIRSGPTLHKVGGESVRFGVHDRSSADALVLLDACLGPHEPLATLPWAPGANFLLRKPFPSRQVHFFPHNLNRRESQQELLEGLDRPELRYVLFDPSFRISPDPSASIASYAPAVVQFIQTNFVQSPNHPQLWLRREVASLIPPPCFATVRRTGRS